MTDPTGQTVVGVVLGAVGTIVVGVLGAVGVLYRSVSEGHRLGRAQSDSQANLLIDRLQARILALESIEQKRDREMERMRESHAAALVALHAEQARLAGMVTRLLGGFRLIVELADDHPELARIKVLAASFLDQAES
jgi:microcompartment protein CcmL/EutN